MENDAPRRIEDADRPLRAIMLARDAVFWHQSGESIWIHAPISGKSTHYHYFLVDPQSLALMRHRFENGEPLQEFEALEAIVKPRPASTARRARRARKYTRK
jgi:hypothetical protein